jgi:hypothetical protein
MSGAVTDEQVHASSLDLDDQQHGQTDDLVIQGAGSGRHRTGASTVQPAN